MTRCTERHLKLGLLIVLVGHVAIAFAQPTPDAFQVQASKYAIEGLERRVADLERLGVDARLRVLENDMFEVKWLTRGVTVAIFSQIGISMVRSRRRNEEDA